MNSWFGLERLLRTDPLDGGCAEAMNMLHVYVERWLAGDNVRSLMPRVAAHLDGCDPCSDDFDGLLAAAS
jgi:hypothetical protein